MGDWGVVDWVDHLSYVGVGVVQWVECSSYMVVRIVH